MAKKNKIVTYTSEEISKMFENTHRSQLISRLKGKKNNWNICNFETGDLVKVMPARPRRKKWTKHNYKSKYYKVSAVNDFYGIVLADSDKNRIKREDNERNQLIVDGYKTSDLFDLDYFLMNNFPVMLDKYAEKYKEIVSPEDPRYDEVINAATELSNFLVSAKERLDNTEDFNEYRELKDEATRVWQHFGSLFFNFWV